MEPSRTHEVSSTAPVAPPTWALRVLLLANVATWWMVASLHDAALYPSGRIERPWFAAWLGGASSLHGGTSPWLQRWCTAGLPFVCASIAVASVFRAQSEARRGGSHTLALVGLAVWSWAQPSLPLSYQAGVTAAELDAQLSPVYGHWAQALSAAAVLALGVVAWKQKSALAGGLVGVLAAWVVHQRLEVQLLNDVWMGNFDASRIAAAEQLARWNHTFQWGSALLGGALFLRAMARANWAGWDGHVRLWLPLGLAAWLASTAAGALPMLEQRAAASRLQQLLAQSRIAPPAEDGANGDVTGPVAALERDGSLRLLWRDGTLVVAAKGAWPSLGRDPLLLFLDRDARVEQLARALALIPSSQRVSLAFAPRVSMDTSPRLAVTERLAARVWAIPILRAGDAAPARVLRPGVREPQVPRVGLLASAASALASAPRDADYLRIESPLAGNDGGPGVVTPPWRAAPAPALAEPWPLRLGPSRWLLPLLLALMAGLGFRSRQQRATKALG